MKERVKGPAIGLIAAGAIGALGGVVNFLWSLIAGVDPLAQMDPDLQLQVSRSALLLIQGVFLLFDLAVCGFLVYAGMQMLQLRQWIVCVIACFAAMVPCFGCCCIGLPFGVWGLVLLLNDEVKQAFTS